MNKKEGLKERTKRYAIEIIKLTRLLPNKPEAWVIGRQLLRSATSVAANYRAACRARSSAELIAKIGVVIEEADESAFWLEVITEVGLIESEKVDPLLKETNELVAIMVTSSKTARKNATTLNNQ